MSGESRKRKRKNRFHRWLAMALTVAMLAGQGKTDVWAQEGADDVPPAAESSEEIKSDAVDGSGAEDNNSDPDQDDENNGGSGDQDTEDDNSPAKGEEPEEGKNTEENGDTENHNPEDGGQENTEGDEDGQDMCVCGTRCTEDAVNVECPVCALDYAACIGKEAEEVLPETVTENTLDEETGIAVLADEDVEAYAVGDTLTYDGITYVVAGAGEVEVGRQDTDVISGDIVIPETLEKDGVIYRVTGIGEEAFAFCTGITSVEIPDSVTSIGICAFQDCRSLTSVKIPDSVTSIGPSVFHNCYSLTRAEIPDGWTNIADAMFRGCNSLTSVNVPEGVTYIGNCAFEQCSSLTSMVIPEGVTRIEECAFEWCSGLTDIVVPKNVTDIEIAAFYACNGLISVTVSENITKIGDRAFEYCAKLKEMRMVVLSDGKIRFPAVGRYAFDGLPDERYIIFVDEAGQELTGETLETAQNAFLEAAKSDGSDDGRWYGWMVRGLSYRPGSGDNGNPGGSSGNSGGDSDSGDGTEDIQVTLVSETTAALTENSAADSTGKTPISGGQEAGTGVAGASVSKDGANGTEERTNAAEPETGDTTHIEIYATIAMIAGLAYLLLYFMEEGRGMTEREKEVFVAAFIRWGKKGGSFRRGCAIVAIFCLLVYYHAIGKCADKNTYLCYNE